MTIRQQTKKVDKDDNNKKHQDNSMLAVKISGQWCWHKWKVDKGHWRGEESWERETAKVWKSLDHFVIFL